MNKKLQVLFLFGACLGAQMLNAQNALDFDGSNDYVDCGTDTSVEIGGKNLTLEAWIYPTNWKTNVFEGNIINKENNNSNYGYMLRCGAGGKLNFAFGSNGTWYELTSASTVLSLNTWQHVAGTYDGSKMRLYVNGSAVDSSNVTAPITKSNIPNLVLGANLNYTTRNYQGRMDEVRIWNVTRSRTQIANGMYYEICGPMPGLRAYFKFNHGKAGKANLFIKTLSDYSGYGNHGSLTNFTLNGSSSNWLSAQSFNRSILNGSDTLATCGSYLSPSRKYVWTQSGVYKDTIVSVMDCDSAITFHLTIKPSGASTIKVHACQSYTSPSGTYTWTQSGNYVDHISNYLGCDSAISIQLSIGGGRDTLYPVTCQPYTLPSGKRTYTVSGHYKDTLKDYRNCDSIIDIYLKRNNATYGSLSPQVCSFYWLPSGKRKLVQSGFYSDTLVNYLGCDSFISIQLSVLNSSSTVQVNTCQSFTSASGKYTWTQSGVYFDTMTNTRFCDSFIRYQVIIRKPSTSTLVLSTCGPYTSPSGKYTHSSSANFNDTLINQAGCDSVISIQLTVTTINTAVTQNGEVLTAQHSGASYRWLDCRAGMSFINGATQLSYTATKNGQYAVEITDKTCVDSSICYTVNNLAVNKTVLNPGMRLFPNPSAGTFEIQLSKAMENATISVTDVSGRVLFSKDVAFCLNEKLVLDLSSGIYMLRVENAQFTLSQLMWIE